MKKFSALLLALMLLFSTALAELTGEYLWPEGSTAETARYVYRYSYPWQDGEDSVSQMINGTYEYLVDDAFGFAIPMAIDELDPASDMQSSTIITATPTFSSELYLSYQLTTQSIMGASSSTIMAGHTFALTGAKAGTILSLPYLLGVLDMDETDEWLKDRQTAKVDACVRDLIWNVIQDQLAEGTIAYYDGLTLEDLDGCFYPEEDYYLDENGSVVFFIQEGYIAPLSEGVLLFPFTMEELLDEI